MSQAQAIEWSVRGKQREFCESQARYRTLVAGRRFGKNHTAITSQADFILNPSHYPHGRDNPEEVVCWWIGPTYNQTKKYGYETAKKAVPDACVVDTRDTQPFEIEVQNGATWEFYSFDRPKSLDGAGVDSMVIDERGYMDTAVWEENLAAMLLDTNGRVAFIGKPWPNEHFRETFEKGQDPSFANYESWHATSYDNPEIPDARIDEIFGDLPEAVYQREIMAQFGASGGIYTPDTISWVEASAVSEDWQTQTVIGVDPAATIDTQKAEQSDSDYWGIVAAEAVPRQNEIYVTDCMQKRGITLTQGVDWLHQMHNAMEQPPKFVVETVAAQEWLKGELVERGLDVTPVTTQTNKEDKLIDLSIPLNNGTVKFVEGDVLGPLKDQLLAFPNGEHDDLADALSLVVNHGPTDISGQMFGGSYGDDLW
jgi:phage terminase large subunit-like protein